MIYCECESRNYCEGPERVRLLSLNYFSASYDLILFLRVRGCSYHAVWGLLLAGLVSYIFTVSIMINFLGASGSLKEPSFKSATLNRDTSASYCSFHFLFHLLYLPYFNFHSSLYFWFILSVFHCMKSMVSMKFPCEF